RAAFCSLLALPLLAAALPPLQVPVPGFAALPLSAAAQSPDFAALPLSAPAHPPLPAAPAPPPAAARSRAAPSGAGAEQREAAAAWAAVGGAAVRATREEPNLEVTWRAAAGRGGDGHGQAPAGTGGALAAVLRTLGRFWPAAVLAVWLGGAAIG